MYLSYSSVPPGLSNNCHPTAWSGNGTMSMLSRRHIYRPTIKHGFRPRQCNKCYSSFRYRPLSLYTKKGGASSIPFTQCSVPHLLLQKRPTHHMILPTFAPHLNAACIIYGHTGSRTYMLFVGGPTSSHGGELRLGRGLLPMALGSVVVARPVGRETRPADRGVAPGVSRPRLTSVRPRGPWRGWLRP